MGKKISANKKIDMLKGIFLPLLKEEIIRADKALEQAKDDYLNLYSDDGDKSKVTINPIFSVVDGQVIVESIGELIASMERMVNE